MPTITLVLRGRRSGPPPKKASPILTPSTLSNAYFPGRGCPVSVLLHFVCIASLAILPLLHLPPMPDPPKFPERRIVMIDLTDPQEIMLLPELFGGGGGGNGKPVPARKESGPPAPGRAERATRGLSYPGPQKVLSDFPNPTNRIQTILQPGLKKPEILKPPIAVPNLVQMAGVVAVPPPPVSPAPEPERQPDPAKSTEPQISEPDPAIQSKPVMIEPVLPVEPPPPPPIEPPAITLPVSPVPPPPEPIKPEPPKPEPPKPELPKPEPPKPLPPKPEPPKPEPPKPEPPKPEPPKPEPAKVAPKSPPVVAPAPKEPKLEPAPEKPKEQPPDPPKVDLTPLPNRSSDLRDLLALSPMPAPREKEVQIPEGEARGRFAMSPQPNLSATETEPGFKIEAVPEPAKKPALPAPVEGPAKALPAIPAAETGSGAEKAKAAQSGGNGNASNAGAAGGSAPAPASGRGMGISVIGGAAPAAGSGTGAGTGTGTGRGSGTGPGVGPGKSPFSGITVIGGGADAGVISGSPAPPRTPRPLQTAYGLSIISTENSGGGLPSFGVFSNEQIYTVYLDMRNTEYDPPQSWTLEFAVAQPAAQGNAGSIRTQEGLILPFPSAKEQPPFPVELVRRYLRRMVIVYALVNTTGKLEQISVKDSPDPALNDILAISLAKWVFRPAQLNGQPVPAKVLMGIPLSLP